MGSECGLQQRGRLAAHGLAVAAGRAPRASFQVLPAAAPTTHPGLVQGVPRPYADGSRAQCAHSPGARAGFERPGSTGMAQTPMSAHTTTAGAGIELDDIQGLLRFGFKHHTEAVFLLLKVRDAAAARQWLGQVPVTSSISLDPPPRTVLQVALT